MKFTISIMVLTTALISTAALLEGHPYVATAGYAGALMATAEWIVNVIKGKN